MPTQLTEEHIPGTKVIREGVRSCIGLVEADLAPVVVSQDSPPP
jgi:hypothetical protein